MKNLDQILKAGGYIYIHVPNPWSLICPSLCGQSFIKFFSKNWRISLTIGFKFYLNKLRKDYLKNRVNYHAGYTENELLELLPGYDVKFMFWERVISQYNNRFIGLIILIVKKLPIFIQNFLKGETYLIAQKPQEIGK